MTGSHEFLTLGVGSQPRCSIDLHSGRLVPSVLGWEGIPANSWDSPLIYGPCHHPPLFSLISGFKTSVTPASRGKRLTGKVSVFSRVQKAMWLLSARLRPAPGSQKERQDSSLRRESCGDGKWWQRVDTRCMLGNVCHSAGSFAGVFTWPSQMHFHLMDEDTESQRCGPTCYSVNKRQSQD